VKDETKQKAASAETHAKGTYENLKSQAKETADQAKHKAEETYKNIQHKGEKGAKETLENLKTGADIVKKEASDKAGALIHEAKDQVEGTADEAVETASSYAHQVSDSFRTFVDSGPRYLTEFKRRYVFPVNKDYRNVGHAGFTLAFLVLSLKLKRGFFVSLKNTAVAAVASGLVFNPEPFNPFLKRNLFYNPK